MKRLRELTARYGVLLIFDEVISGFRCSPGGAQQFYDVIPDLTTLAKILAGGYPGAALVGRADVLGVLDYRQIERDTAASARGSSRHVQRGAALSRGGHCDSRAGPPHATPSAVPCGLPR